MGCEVVSVYADEIVGKVTYSDRTVADIAARDYHPRQHLPQAHMAAKTINSLYGFASSLPVARLHFAQIASKEYLVQVAGRFIVVWDSVMGQRVAANPEVISSWDVQGRLCLVGLPGGTLLLWDLQFLEIKLELLLPVGALNVTSVSLTNKSLFAIDTTQSPPSAYCYDIRTGKLKSFTTIATFQSAVKGITAGDELHAYVCCEGVWFIKMKETGLQAVRGMFGGYPRTAMECLQRTGNYLLTGGIDGYVYLWSTQTYKCIRAFKVGQLPINSMASRNKQLVLAVGEQRIKMYTFDVKPSEKKQVKQEYDEEGEVRREETDEFAFVQADSFSQDGTIVAMAISQADPLMYYCLTRQGVFCRKWLPAPSADQRKSTRTASSDFIQKSNTSGKLRLIGGKVYSAYKTTGFAHEVTVLKLNNKALMIEEERVAQSSEAVGDADCAYCPQTQELVYVTSGKKLNVCLTYNKLGDAIQNAGQSDLGNSNKTIEELALESVLSIDFTARGWLVVTTSESIFVFERKGKLQYQEIQHRKYEKEVPQELKVANSKLIYESEATRWREEDEKWRSLSTKKVEEWELVHGGKVKSRSTEWEESGLSCGCGHFIFWK